MDIREELKSAGTYPTGPVSAWPKVRHDKLSEVTGRGVPAKKVRASATSMAKGLLKTAGQAAFHGRVSKEIREERYNTCKGCPAFIAKSKRCSECGCFMEAKTWVGGNKDSLCPLKKWSR